MDYSLLTEIAKTFKDDYVVMVGPITNDNYKKAGLDKMLNVVFTGRKDLEQLPDYLRWADCCIIPFLCNELTKSIYPLKINEYLAAGKPVVTTDFSEDIINFGDVALVSRTSDEFIANIRRSLSEDSEILKETRMRAAFENSWDNRAKQLMNWISSKLK